MRTLKLTDPYLHFEPENEMGVVFLFSRLADSKYGLSIESVQSGFPDCIANKDGKRIRIEFEYRSRNFSVHRHNPKECDWIVCWIDDWPEAPGNLQVIELRKVFGLGFSVWVVPIAGDYRERISEAKNGEEWTAPKHGARDDLVLYYRTAPDKFIKDIFVMEDPKYQRAGFKRGKEWLAKITRVAKLANPVLLDELRSHPSLGDAGFVRGGFRSRYRVTSFWPQLRELILEKNPHLSRKLSRFNS